MQFADNDIERFAAWSGDFNPLHVDREFAQGTSFKQPIVHGMLSVIGALGSMAQQGAGPLQTLDIEFRGAVFPGCEYDIDVTRAADELSVTVGRGTATVLSIRGTVGNPAPSPTPLPANTDLSWTAALQANAAIFDAGKRLAPVDRRVAEFQSGIEITGAYATDPPPEGATINDCLTPLAVRVLGLCSYLIGMESPGLRSLFTRASLVFHETQPDSNLLWYRARTTRFDPNFRILDTILEVTTPDAQLVAVCELRSYVRFTPIAIDLDALAATLTGDARRLQGKVALVIGGSRGLGADLTAALALAGARVYASSHSQAATPLAQALAERGLNVEFLKGDASDPAWCSATLDDIRARHGRLDLLVLNACAPPAMLRISAESTAHFDEYLRANLRLATTPLATCLPLLDESRGAVICISSSFVADPQVGFAHYVALKQAVEAAVHTATRESSSLYSIVVRPPRLLTSWNDTPTGVLGAIPSDRVAAHVVGRLAREWHPGQVETLSDFSANQATAASAVTSGDTTPAADHTLPAISIVVAATFTAEPVVPAFQFWLKELALSGRVEVAPYGQLLPELLNPASRLTTNSQGFNVVLLRVRDWLRELADDKAGSIDYLRSYLPDMARDFEQAMKSHRAHASSSTLLVLCPSSSSAGSFAEELLTETEAHLVAALRDIPGLHTVMARDFHAIYGVAVDQIDDPLRDKIAHVPFRDSYFDILATIAMRCMQRHFAAVRKVVVVDCDNTLWRGVVGELGPDGIEIDQHHRRLHATLERLSHNGVLICLCSKNEELDVWQVFETRSDLKLGREQIVAAAINWLPKSENLRSLASRLNLGLESFIFIDDNPVECAEVTATCPEVLTLRWPQEPDEAQRLLDHTWELDSFEGTREDRERTQLYREEFRRQALREETLTFQDFIDRLELVVDIGRLLADDLKRASQLTLRTNQFNFTTVRREESEMQSLLAAGNHEIYTVKVRDRFGDYGLVGLLIIEPRAGLFIVDTFLLSCRVMGRGVEHKMAAELGRLALEQGARAVQLKVATTKRNEPARAFVEAISPEECRTADDTGLTSILPAAVLAEVRFAAPEAAQSAAAEAGATRLSAGAVAVGPRRREQQIARTANDLATADQLHAAIAGRLEAPAATGVPAGMPFDEIGTVVYEVFARALKLSVSQVREVDRLEALGCGSFRIVEITVDLVARFPWLPSTLLFEHRSVAEIVRNIAELAQARAAPAAIVSSIPQPSPTARADTTMGLDVAVVGLNVRCAGARSADELWNLLSAGGTSVKAVHPDREFFLGRLHDDRPHFAGLLDEIDRFDPEFFGISPREAALMDPQLRLFLEVAWGALEDAGSVGTGHDVDTGVFAGAMYGDYAYRANLTARNSENPYKCWEGFSLANRFSQVMGFRGPSVAVDTACSSSATALHLACQALHVGDCTTAVVGGVNLILDPDRFTQLGRLGILSLSGHCRPFGAEADGTVLGEGVGVVVLRPLSEALRRGDRVYGVIKATAVSTGNGTVGFTAPNPQAQSEAIRRCLQAASVDPRTISYVETHGTGTALGDPIEVRGLTLAYLNQGLWNPSITAAHRCRLGAIKPNVGHLEAGAGIVGMIKVLLQLEHGMFVPSLSSNDTNPQIPFHDIPFEVQRAHEPWERSTINVDGKPVTIPRRAGISSFGVGGANAHIIVEEAPADHAEPLSVVDRPRHLLTLSARTEEALAGQVAGLKQHLEVHSDLRLADASYTANVGRRHFEHRLALPVASCDELKIALAQFASGEMPVGCARGTVVGSGAPPKIAFLFTGQGSQSAGMGRLLYDTYPVFRDALDRCARILNPLLGRSLLEVLFAEPGSADAQLLDQTGFTQPALFAIEFSLAELWHSWGVVPAFVMGHSVGEIAALCIAGGVSLEDGMKLIAARGRLMQALPAGGGMTSIMACESRVRAAIAGYEDRVSIAAINGPEHVVITGEERALAEISASFVNEGIRTKPLTVSHAFHSPLMNPMLDEYGQVVRAIRFQTPVIPFISGVRGELVGDEIANPEYWIRQVREPVRFSDAMAAIEREGATAYLEIGPHPVLLGMGRQCLRENSDDKLWLPSLRRDVDAWQTILATLAQLHVQGAAIDWRSFDAPFVRRIVALPTYSFSGRRFWIDVPLAAVEGDGKAVSSRPLLYDLAWRKQPRAENGKFHTDAGHWVVLADRGGLGTALAELLEQNGAKCTLVRAGETFTLSVDGTYEINPAVPADFMMLWKALAAAEPVVRGVVHLWSLDVPSTVQTVNDLLASRKLSLESTVHLLQALVQADKPVATSLWLVTRGANSPEPADPREIVSIGQTPLWGLGRTIALEHPALWGGLVDLSTDGDARSELKGLVRELLTPDGEDQVAFRGDTRFVPRLAHLECHAKRKRQLSGEATYLVTGGLGALGHHMAHWLVSQGARHLVLTSRRGMQTPGAEETLQQLTALGATVEIVAANIASEQAVDRVLDRIRASGSLLRGVIHTAGIDAITPLPGLSADELSSVLAPKIEGSWLLHDRTRALDLDLFVCFSSISAVLGSAGRAAYGAANAFLDGLAHERKRLGLAALSVNWGPWLGGGMATPEGLLQLERMGNRGLIPEDAIAALETLLEADLVQATVADIDWEPYRAVYEARRTRPILAELESRADAPGQTKRIPTGACASSKSDQALASDRPVGQPHPEWVNRLHETPIEQRSNEMLRLLRGEVAQTLGFRKSEEVHLDKTFHEMGMDSLLAVEFANRLRRRLGIRNPALVFDYPYVEKLAVHLLGQIEFSDSQLPSTESHEKDSPPTAAVPQGIVGYRPGIETEVLEFQKRAWPRRRQELLAPRWQWMYVASGRRLAVEPRVWLYRDSENIVGHNGAIPVKLKVGSAQYLTAWFVETMVLETHRNQAVGSRLLMQASEDLPFSLSLGQTEQMRQINLQLGWLHVAPLATAQLLIHPEAVLKGKLSAPAAIAAGWGLRATTAVRTMLQRHTRLDVQQVTRFDVRHDRLWEVAARDILCGVVRDASYLNWKYVDQPGQEFVRIEIVDGDTVRGVVVLMFRDADEAYPYRRGFLVDLLAPLSDEKLLRQLVHIASTAAAEREADALFCLHISQRLTQALKQNGFLMREPGRFLLVNPGELPEEARRQVLAGKEWFVTQGDSDIDRP